MSRSRTHLPTSDAIATRRSRSSASRTKATVPSPARGTRSARALRRAACEAGSSRTLAVPIEAADLAARGDRPRPPRRARRSSHEALHRVQVDVEARLPRGDRLVEALGADDGDARPASPATPRASSFARSRSTSSTSGASGREALALASPALPTWCDGQRARRDASSSIAGARGPAPPGWSEPRRSAPRHRDGPGLAERRVLERDEPLGVAEAGGALPRALSDELCPVGAGPREHGRDDERPQPRPEAVLVDADEERAISVMSRSPCNPAMADRCEASTERWGARDHGPVDEGSASLTVPRPR